MRWGGSATRWRKRWLAPASPSIVSPSAPGSPPTAASASDINGLLAGAARDLADYQRLTAEGKLGEAGQKLEALKQKLERLNSIRR